MYDYMQHKAWIDLPQGRVRYAGVSNRDEPKEEFAISLAGNIYYGEIKREFLPDRNNFNLVIISFGWPNRGWEESSPKSGVCTVFTISQLKIIQQLIYQAVMEWRKLKDKPFVVNETNKSHFMGEIVFHEGWALIKDEGVVS